jgi:hypothetical protein
MEVKDMPAWISAIAAVISAGGLIFTFLQIRLIKKQSITQFEDGLNKEYRDIIGKLPAIAMLGKELDKDEFDKMLDEFFHYFDLCNEQVFLRQCGRISDKTWKYWKDGIKENLNRKAFRRAWNVITSNTDNNQTFLELRMLESKNFIEDPQKWPMM